MTDIAETIARVRELDAEGTARRAYLRDGPDTPYARRQRELLGAAFAVRDASGRVNGCAIKHLPLAERFWRYVQKDGPGGCWIWLGRIAGGGYGRIQISKKERPAHQVAWELVHGTPFPDSEGRHSCDTALCVNPAHIVPGSRSENARDAISRGWRPGKRPKHSHCIRGHELSGANLYHRADGGRRCAECVRLRGARRKARAGGC